MTELAICILTAVLTTSIVITGYLWTQLISLRTRMQDVVYHIANTLALLSTTDRTLAEQDVKLLEMIQKLTGLTGRPRADEEEFEVN